MRYRNISRSLATLLMREIADRSPKPEESGRQATADIVSSRHGIASSWERQEADRITPAAKTTRPDGASKARDGASTMSAGNLQKPLDFINEQGPQPEPHLTQNTRTEIILTFTRVARCARQSMSLEHNPNRARLRRLADDELTHELTADPTPSLLAALKPPGQPHPNIHT